MRPRLKKFLYHQPRFDSMPEEPGMGYFMQGWGVHDPGFNHGVYVERTRGKVNLSSDPRMRSTHANTRIHVSSYPLGINWTFNLHPRHVEFEFGYAWRERREDYWQHYTASAPYVPEASTVWRDVKRHRDREHLSKREWERVDPPKDVGPYYAPYGDPNGITTVVPGIYFKAWQPLNARAHYLVLNVHADGDEVVRQYRVRLTYEPRFGIDEGDAYAFDVLTRDVEAAMLKDVWQHEKPPCPACHEPLWTSHVHDGVLVEAHEDVETVTT